MPATSTNAPPTERRSARDRLLDAADELFYEEGVHTVGIDRVIEKAGVAKASLYSIFGSKEELIRAYLERRHALRQERTKRGLERYDNPRDKLLGVFDVLAQMISRPGYRGCAFANATAESPSASAAATVSETNRAWFRSLLTELAAAAGAGDPKLLAGQLALLYDGALTSSRMDHDRKAPARAKAAAAALLDASIP